MTGPILVAAEAATADPVGLLAQLGVGGSLVSLAIFGWKKMEGMRSDISVQNRNDIASLEAKHAEQIAMLREDLDKEKAFQVEDAEKYRLYLADLRAEHAQQLQAERDANRDLQQQLIDALQQSIPTTKKKDTT